MSDPEFTDDDRYNHPDDTPAGRAVLRARSLEYSDPERSMEAYDDAEDED